MIPLHFQTTSKKNVFLLKHNEQIIAIVTYM